eukprot:5183_1
MGGFDDHIRQLNNYNTIFGSFWFNILCVGCNLTEIVTSVVLLGYYHNVITIDYIWWPLIEMLRLFILTILRFDVMLKGVENYDENRSGFKYTKRMILICNLIGFFVILIGAPIYLALLSTPTNSKYGNRWTIYTVFMIIYPCFIMIRICLTLPMYCTLLLGTNPIYALNHGYQRIDDAVASRHRRRTRRQRSHGDGYEEDERETQEDRVRRQIRRQVRLMELEQRQMQLAMEQSRQVAYRNTVKEQDQEYEEALREAKESEEKSSPFNLEQCDSKMNLMNGDVNMNISEDNVLSSNPISSVPITSNDDYDYNQSQSDLMDMGLGPQSEDTYSIDRHITLDPLPDEAADDNECVYIRMRLPNGVRSERRFHYTSNIGDIIIWSQHECMKHGQTHLIGHSQIVSTMPHTVYEDKRKNLKMLNFWRPNSPRKLVSPLLYVEEL